MVSLRRFLLICTLALLAAPPALASLQATVDRNPVAMNESFTLTLQSDGSSGGEPDLSVLRRDFDVLGQSKSSSIQIINGQTSRSVQWQISLMPKRSGQLQIPAISLGGQSSQPIALTVSAASQPQAAPGGDLFLEVSAKPRVAYVEQQIVFTVRLYRKIDLGNGSTLSEPSFPKMNALVERLGGDRSFQTLRNGQAYSVIERRYAVYPQKSGQFRSAPVVFDGDVIEGGGLFSFDPFGQNSRHLRLTSQSIDLSVKPMPAGATASQWLPASKLLLTEQWSEHPPKFTVGDPITRTLTLTASGLTAAQLPSLAGPPIAGLKLYPDQPTLKDSPDDQGITGTRVQKIAIIPTRAGNITLPAIEVKWWNIDTDTEAVATLPARSITVLPGARQPAPPPSIRPTRAAPGSLAGAQVSAGWWPWLALSLGLGWLATLIAWAWRTRKKSRPVQPSDTEEPLRQLERQLKRDCLANDASRAKTQLQAWAKRRWPTRPPTSLTALARLCDPELAEALNELDRTLYSGAGASWQGEKLWRAFSQHRPADKENRPEQASPLEPLYRSP